MIDQHRSMMLGWRFLRTTNEKTIEEDINYWTRKILSPAVTAQHVDLQEFFFMKKTSLFTNIKKKQNVK